MIVRLDEGKCWRTAGDVTDPGKHKTERRRFMFSCKLVSLWERHFI